jgi:hypothetical protein
MLSVTTGNTTSTMKYPDLTEVYGDILLAGNVLLFVI